MDRSMPVKVYTPDVFAVTVAVAAAVNFTVAPDPPAPANRSSDGNGRS
jgi:hypothetical protein